MPQLHFNDEIAPLVEQLADGTTVYRTATAGIGCHKLGCGVKCYVKDGKLIKVEGDEANPISKGRLCVRCLTAVDYVYHPDRLLHPMKRDRSKRGLDAWEQISWDEAYEMIVENYQKTVEQYGIQAVTVWNGTGRENSCYHFTFANDVFGTPNAVHPNSGWSCLVPRMASMLWTMGSSYIEADNAAGFPDRYDDPRWVCPKYMLILGRDPLRSNADGLFGHSIIEMMRRGMKLIVADPRANWLATRAFIHLQLRPGTDGALAMALLNVAITENLYDHDFVENWTYGFEALTERVQDYTPEWAAEICDLDADDIRAAARCLSEKPSTLSMGLAVDQNPNTMQIGHALLSFFAICGHMDVPGGCFMGLPPIFAGMAEVAGAAHTEEGEPEGLEKFGMVGVEPLGHDRFPAMSAIVNTTHPDTILDAMELSVPYGIHFAYVLGHNSIANMVVQPERYANALRNIDFVAIADLFMTPMIMDCADLVLPVTTAFEHDNFINNSNASQPGQLHAMTHVIEPLGECRSDLQIMVDLHNLLYPNSTKPQWASVEAYLNDDLGKIGGIDITMDELRSHVYGQYEIEYKKYEKGLLRGGTPGFNTATGRIELWSTMLQRLGDDPLPYYIEPKFSATSRPDLAVKYPLTLTTGARRFTSFHSENRQIPVLREIHKWPTMDISPAAAAERGITEGSWVWVENQLGRTRMCAHVTPWVKDYVVSCDHGWWMPENDPEKLFDCMTYNINNLIPHETNGPLGFGTHYKCMPCQVYLDENQMAPSNL